MKGEKCFNCGEYTAYKTGLGDYACSKCGIYSKDNKEPYQEDEGMYENPPEVFHN